MDPFDRPDWMQRAACAELDPIEANDLFFVRVGRPTRHGKAICARCPVVDECLEYGLGERFGIWGGTTERERRAIRQRRQAEEIAS